MDFFKNMWVGVLCLMCGSCRLLWAQDLDPQTWKSPLLQTVSVPAGVKGGVYYPAHEQLVIVKPGAWKVSTSVDPGHELAEEGVDEKEQIGAVKGGARVSLRGRRKLGEVVEDIARVQGLHATLGPGVEDREIVAGIDDVPAGQALRDILFPLGYGAREKDGVLTVLAQDTRIFRLALPPVTQAFTTGTSNESSNAALSSGNVPGDGRSRIGARVHVENSSRELSYWQDVEANVKGLVSAQGVMSLNRSAGALVVTDSMERLERIGVLVEEMNARAREQLVVDVKVVEVELSREHTLGIDWNAMASGSMLKAAGLSTDFVAQNMPSGNVMTFTARADKETSGDGASGVKLVLKALEAFGRVDMVSQPRLMMLNNTVASIQVGETRAYVESTNIETTPSGATVTSAALNQVHGGVTLQIMASIAGEEFFMNVTPVVSTIDGIRTIALGGGSKLEAPDTSIKTISTQVRIKAGQTVAIGGLITRQSESRRQGVPFLSRIPVIGRAFSYDLHRRGRSELVIFLTPTRG